ncbi:ABC transporter ATP-binding protein [Frankia sp. AgB1.9]|uniref:ABC transporter ATP-binding protein n=1 Tax=unclassified Frankia TaxID=2632575 RepID=UPI0019335B1F|nr:MULTISPECIES: ABC transporter ATP-binding protein [unclassified Frankia]MBL7493595.1 ABC transporter ATP-binding protein [Frankia sp. AgW1.1]MBL7551370.1 ABC transporter ATP-binding protein [Frankia sp. AgB1.9]MBL7618945.1 ABC transporter ATP-binding protein [Frankia sp. AgB1.8]
MTYTATTNPAGSAAERPAGSPTDSPVDSSAAAQADSPADSAATTPADSSADSATAGPTLAPASDGITLAGVVKRYGGSHAALDVPHLGIPAGSFTVVVGPSGCGKSTGLRVIAGLETADAGQVVIDGADVTGLPAGDRGVAMVFQDFALYPQMTVERNISFGLRLAARHDRRHGPSRDEIESRVAEVCARLGLSDLRRRLPRQLSGGERQRVGLARAIVRRPAVLLLDEPLSSLDAQLRQRARAELVRLHRELGNTVVLVTHDQLEALSMGTNLVVMNRGRVVQTGPPEQVYRYPADTFVATFLGSPPMNLHTVTPSTDLVGPSGEGPVLTGPGVAARLPGGARPGPVLLGWRPADGLIELADEVVEPADGLVVPADHGVVLRGVVDVVEFTGDGTVVTCVSPGEDTPWAVSIPGRDRVPVVGDPVRVRVAAERVHLFDPESGRRLDERISGAVEH